MPRLSRMTCVDKVGVAMATQIFGLGPTSAPSIMKSYLLYFQETVLRGSEGWESAYFCTVGWEISSLESIMRSSKSFWAWLILNIITEVNQNQLIAEK